MSDYIPSTHEIRDAYVRQETKRNDIRKVEHSDYGKEFDNWLDRERQTSYSKGYTTGSRDTEWDMNVAHGF